MPVETFVCMLCAFEKPVKTKMAFTGKRNDSPPVLVEGKPICEYCLLAVLATCKACNKPTTRSPERVVGANTYCPVCIADDTFVCAFGGETRERSQLWTEIDGYGKVCTGCRTRYKEEFSPPPIQEYGFKPQKPKLFGTSGLYFGVELEVDSDKNPDGARRRQDVPDYDDVVENNTAVAALIRKEVPDRLVYVKSDSSVPSGMELVTHPMSWDWIQGHKSHFDPIFALVKKGYVSHDSGRCGMHVHLTKSAFTKLQLYKFLRFFYDNQAFILMVSQRGTKPSSMLSYTRIEYYVSENKELESKENNRLFRGVAAGHSIHIDRHVAVNAGGPDSKTVEVRIFRGTLKRERFFKNLEFCKALFGFCLEASVSKCTVEQFVGYVHAHLIEYPNLYAFLKERYTFSVLKKNVKKGKFKDAIRFSGPKRLVADTTDVPDEEWAGMGMGEKREAAVQKKILIASSQK